MTGGPALPAPESVSVRLERVSKDFGRARVLHDIDLVVPAGTTACVIGPSGSGKSTLLRTITRLEEPSAGRIFVGETEVTAPATDIDRLRSRVGMVFQTFNLFPHISVRRNVSLALERVRGMARADALELAEAQLAAVGLAGFGDRRPGQLSGGQQQRVAIARALAMRPAVMLFDEATSALDPELVKGILEIMRDLAASGMTMVVVTHELRFEEGPPERLFEAPESPRLRHFLAQML
jgi:polar amino acid transport system ATP-binding protein